MIHLVSIRFLQPTSAPQYRMFHASGLQFMLPTHRLFPLVEWDRVDAGDYAVVDPFSPSRILYLTEADYIVQVRVSQTNNKTLKVLAAPGDSPDKPNHQNTPPHPFLDSLFTGKQTHNARRGKQRVQYLFHSMFSHYRSRGVDGSVESMITVDRKILRSVIRQWHDLVSWWSRGVTITTVAKSEVYTFAGQLSRRLEHNGINTVIKVLKISLFVVNTFLGGTKMTSTQSLGYRVRLTNGLPVLLPKFVRLEIRKRNLHFIHIWTSVLNMYKGIQGTYGKISLDTITNKGPDITHDPVFDCFYRGFAKTFWRVLNNEFGIEMKPSLIVSNYFFTLKAGPNHPNSVLGAGRDAHLWFNHTSLGSNSGINVPLEWLNLVGDKVSALMFRKIAKMETLTRATLQSMVQNKVRPIWSLFGYSDSLGVNRGVLSLLHALYEPAGKIRIIAIVDYWTNFCLKPLHDWMFSVLKRIPTDATFDQEGALKRFAQRRNLHVYSIDLTAATDTIPLILYRILFSQILKEEIVDLWLKFLTDRPFLLPREFFPKKNGGYRPPFNLNEDFVTYGTGQPMGALSSWPSMALVHHALVQYAAFLLYLDSVRSPLSENSAVFESWTWYLNYLVLGDDIVIGDKKVAQKYLLVLEALGIKASLAKSYISDKGLFNFANQTYIGELNTSPLSFKEEIGISSLAQRAELAMRAVRRGWTDMSHSAWVAPLVKFFVSPQLWNNNIRVDLAKGQTHPVVNWILSVLLVPGSARFAETVMPRASIKTYLATLLRKAVIWNKPIGNIDLLIKDRSWSLVNSILQSMVDRVYNDFLSTRKSLLQVKTWIEETTPVAIEPLLLQILELQVAESLKVWTEKYRFKLKEIQVVGKLPSVTPGLYKLGTLMSVNELTLLIVEAQHTLPTITPYQKLNFDDLISTLASNDDFQSARRFNANMRALNAVDDLNAIATPGIDNTLDQHQLE